MSKHNPGPWTHGQSAVYRLVKDSKGEIICFASMKQNDAANARLIAAAPDMYEACHAFCEAYEKVNPNPDDWPDLYVAYHEAKEIISKVKGE